MAFSVSIFSLVLSEHLPLHRIVLSQRRRIQESRAHLSERVEERTHQLRSTADKEVLVREVHHRSKNNLQIVSSLVRLAFDDFEEDHIAPAVHESQDRIYTMAMIHEQLYASPRLSRIDFGEYLHTPAAHVHGVYHCF